MFESIEPERQPVAKRLVALLVSTALHAAVVSSLIVVPLIYFNVLPATSVLTYLVAPPALPPPPPPRRALTAPHRAVVATYQAPTRIPKGIPAPILEPPPEGAILAAGLDGGAQDGISGGIPGGVPGGVLGGLPGSLSPPRPLPPPPAPLPKPRARKPIHVGGALQASKLIHKIDPAYPILAKRARVSGTVVLEVTILFWWERPSMPSGSGSTHPQS
ncbi:MAG TPA: hypothetical protein VE398_00705 [Acidobacteriota bacterium]|nr:hypothetical protein [Acidobacteriota bacterium]